VNIYNRVYTQRVYSDRTPGGVAGEPVYNGKYFSQNIQAYPNPFIISTNIRYQVSATQFMSLKVYNISGQLVKTVFSGMQQPGIYNAMWDGRDDNNSNVASGIYLVAAGYGQRIKTQKITKLK
jgi:hypothetical protein